MSWLGEWWRRYEFAVVIFLVTLLVGAGLGEVAWKSWATGPHQLPPSQTCGAKEVAQALGSARVWEEEAEKAQARYEEALSKLKTCRDDLEHELRVKVIRRQACEDDLIDQQVPAQELLREKKR